MDPIEFNGIFMIYLPQTQLIVEYFWPLWSLIIQDGAELFPKILTGTAPWD